MFSRLYELSFEMPLVVSSSLGTYFVSSHWQTCIVECTISMRVSLVCLIECIVYEGQSVDEFGPQGVMPICYSAKVLSIYMVVSFIHVARDMWT